MKNVFLLLILSLLTGLPLSASPRAAAEIKITERKDVTCPGANDGSITVEVIGGQSASQISWNDGGSGATRRNLADGIYVATASFVSAGEDDVTSDTIYISAPSAVRVGIANQSDPACNGSTNGIVELRVKCGAPGYTINWSDAGAGPARDDLAAGDYAVTVVDAEGCDVPFAAITVNDPELTENCDDGRPVRVFRKDIAYYYRTISRALGGISASSTEPVELTVTPGVYEEAVGAASKNVRLKVGPMPPRATDD